MISDTSQQPRQSWFHRLPFYYGWLILAVGGLGMLISAPGQTYVVSIFVEPMLGDLGWSRTMYSGLYTGGSLVAALAVPFVGRLLDRFGSRVMLTAIAMLFGLATILLSQVNTPVHLFLGFIAIRALGQGSLGLIVTTMAAMWFVRMRGRAMALMALASPASQASFPILTFFLISSLGWRNAWIVLGIIIWVTLIPVGVFLVRRSPESVGMLPDGDRQLPRSSSTQTTSSVADDWTLGEAIRTKAFWMLMAIGISLSSIGTALVFHNTSLLISKGLDAGMAAGVLSFIAPMAVLGTFITGFLSDKLPNRFLLAAGQAMIVLTLVMLLFVVVPWQAFVYGALMGITQGSVMTMNNVIWPNYFGRAHIGSIRGIATTAMVGGSALGPLPFGYLFDLTENYDTAVIAFIGLPIAGVMLSLIATPPRKKVDSTSAELSASS